MHLGNDDMLAKLMRPSSIDSRITRIRRQLKGILNGELPVVLSSDDEFILSTTCKSSQERDALRRAMEKTRRYYQAEELLEELIQSFVESQKQIAGDFAKFLQGNEQFKSKTENQKLDIVDNYLGEIGAPDALRDPSSAFFVELRKHII